MAFIVEELSIELIEALVPVITVVQRRDRSLSDQLRRAANRVALNIGESNHSDPGNRRARLFTAAGSASEVRVALRVAVASRCAREAETALARELVDRVIAILWKLTHK
jgi:four helix bundle protein